jgi:hypothetical protein
MTARGRVANITYAFGKTTSAAYDAKEPISLRFYRPMGLLMMAGFVGGTLFS